MFFHDVVCQKSTKSVNVLRVIQKIKVASLLIETQCTWHTCVTVSSYDVCYNQYERMTCYYLAMVAWKVLLKIIQFQSLRKVFIDTQIKMYKQLPKFIKKSHMQHLLSNISLLRQSDHCKMPLCYLAKTAFAKYNEEVEIRSTNTA